jgi:hypothetical protein
MQTETINQPLTEAQSARVTIDAGVARLKLSRGEAPATLIEGTANLVDGTRLEQEARSEGGKATLSLRQRSNSPFSWFSGIGNTDVTWDLRLAGSVPLELVVKSGVGQSDLNLAGLNLTSLEVNAGVGSVEIRLPNSGRTQAVVKAGVGEVTVRVPQGVAAKVVVSTGLGATSVEGLYDRRGDTHTSPGYEEAANRVDLRIKGGVGRVRVLND